MEKSWIDEAKELLPRAEERRAAGAWEEAADIYERLSSRWMTGASAAASEQSRRTRMDQSIKFREIARDCKRRAAGVAEEPASANAAAPDSVGSTCAQTGSGASAPEGKLGRIRAQLSNDAIGQMLIAQVDGFAQTSSVTWEDIGGLDGLVGDLKKALAAAVVRYPDGIRREASGDILLVGPPGTGKTMLAAALANSICLDGMEGRFYNVGLAGLKGHYQGNTEKAISLLYETARENSPSLVFMDEIDSLCTARGEGTGDAASRAILGVMLSEMDGMARKKGDPGTNFVLTVAATNTPWSLDAALLSRFGENRILVPAPDASGRKAILEKLILAQGYSLDDGADLAWLADDARTSGYSGRDLRSLTSVAKRAMEMEMNPGLSLWKDLKEVAGTEVRLRPLTHADFEAALGKVPPSISDKCMEDYRRWCEDPNWRPSGH